MRYIISVYLILIFKILFSQDQGSVQISEGVFFSEDSILVYEFMSSCLSEEVNRFVIYPGLDSTLIRWLSDARRSERSQKGLKSWKIFNRYKGTGYLSYINFNKVIKHDLKYVKFTTKMRTKIPTSELKEFFTSFQIALTNKDTLNRYSYRTYFLALEKRNMHLSLYEDLLGETLRSYFKHKK